MPVFLALFISGLLRLCRFRREDVRCGQDLVEVLELLSRLEAVGITNEVAIDLGHVREPIHDECSH